MKSHASAQSWVVLTALFAVANTFEIVLFSNLSAFTPVFLQNIGYDDASVKLWTGILASAGIALGFWFVPFWGVLADRHGRKLLILRSFAVEAVAVMLMAFSQNVWVFLFGRMMTGLALGNTGLMFATLADRAPRARVGLAISIVTGSTPVGGVIGPLFGGFVVSHWGVHALFAASSIMISLIVVMLALWYRETFVPGPVYPVGRMLAVALRSVVHTPVVLAMFGFSFIASSSFFFSFPFIPNRIVELVGPANSGGVIGLVYGIAGVATLLATPVWGLLADRLGHRRLLPYVALLTGVLYLPIYLATNIVELTTRLFLLNAVSPAVNSLTFATIGVETPTEKRGSVMSMIYMPLNASILIAPALAVAVTSTVSQVFLYSALLMFFAVGVLLFANRAAGPIMSPAAERERLRK